MFLFKATKDRQFLVKKGYFLWSAVKYKMINVDSIIPNKVLGKEIKQERRHFSLEQDYDNKEKLKNNKSICKKHFLGAP